MTNPTDAQRDGVTTVVDLGLDVYVEGVAQANGDVALAVARAANELAAANEKLANLTVADFVATIAMEQSGQLSATQAKTVLSQLLAKGGDPVSIAKAKGFEQLSTDSLSATVGELIVANPDEWQRFKDGDDKLAQFFIGLVMKATKGQANGKAVIAELQSRR
jgi:aspartyl-tRNA(Asn)/glutamyl-tRNA(Gln) amidotransferase subunit B